MILDLIHHAIIFNIERDFFVSVTLGFFICKVYFGFCKILFIAFNA